MKKVRNRLLHLLIVPLVVILVVLECFNTAVIKADTIIGSLNGKPYDDFDDLVDDLEDDYEGKDVVQLYGHAPYTEGGIEKPEEILHNLFDVLRSFDEVKVDRILAEDLSEEDTTGALMNRLLKSAGGNFLKTDEL